MPSITDLLRALGNDRAVANAKDSLDRRAREEWVVAGLARRLEQPTAPAGAAGEPVPAGSGTRERTAV